MIPRSHDAANDRLVGGRGSPHPTWDEEPKVGWTLSPVRTDPEPQGPQAREDPVVSTGKVERRRGRGTIVGFDRERSLATRRTGRPLSTVQRLTTRCFGPCSSTEASAKIAEGSSDGKRPRDASNVARIGPPCVRHRTEGRPGVGDGSITVVERWIIVSLRQAKRFGER